MVASEYSSKLYFSVIDSGYFQYLAIKTDNLQKMEPWEECDKKNDRKGSFLEKVTP